jgi:hypothetical protein
VQEQSQQQLQQLQADVERMQARALGLQWRTKAGEEYSRQYN